MSWLELMDRNWYSSKSSTSRLATARPHPNRGSSTPTQRHQRPSRTAQWLCTREMERNSVLATELEENNRKSDLQTPDGSHT